MVDIAPRISGKGQLLAHGRDGPPVPASAGEGALRVLPLRAEDGQAVGLYLDRAVPDGIVEPPACVHRRQDHRLLAGDVGHAEALEGPAGDGNITVLADPFRVDDAAKAIVERKSTRLNSSHYCASRMPSSA